jgi:hypothetical protein
VVGLEGIESLVERAGDVPYSSEPVAASLRGGVDQPEAVVLGSAQDGRELRVDRLVGAAEYSRPSRFISLIVSTSERSLWMTRAHHSAESSKSRCRGSTTGSPSSRCSASASATTALGTPPRWSAGRRPPRPLPFEEVVDLMASHTGP